MESRPKCTLPDWAQSVSPNYGGTVIWQQLPPALPSRGSRTCWSGGGGGNGWTILFTYERQRQNEAAGKTSVTKILRRHATNGYDGADSAKVMTEGGRVEM